MTDDKPSQKRKRPFLLQEMIAQSQRVRSSEINPDSQKAESDLRRVAEEATQLIKKINQPGDHSQSHSLDHSQSHNHHVRPSLSPTLSPTLSPSVSQSVPHSVPHSVSQSEQPSEGISEQLCEQPSKQHSKQHSKPHSESSDDPFWSLTERQAKILTFLIENKTRITKHSLISAATGFPYLSVRDALYNLTRDGFLKQKIRFRRGNFQGFRYILDEEKCLLFQQRQASQQAAPRTMHSNNQAQHSEQQSEQHSEQQSVSPTVCATVYYSSSSLFNKTTTTKSENHKQTKSAADAIADALATHPELGYWRQKQLTPQQVQKWMEMTGASLESMVQSLCHCRYEMVEMNLEQEKNIQNVFNWFYRIIERAGFYPKPKGYQSYLERQLEIEQKLLAEKQERLKALRELQRQKKEAERNLAFYEMLSQPDSELYQQCFSRLNKFTQTTKNASLFERFMRDAFDQIMDEQEQQEVAEARQGGDGAGPSGGDGRGP